MTELQAILKLMSRVEELERQLAEKQSGIDYWYNRALRAEGTDPKTVSHKPIELGKF